MTNWRPGVAPEGGLLLLTCGENGRGGPTAAFPLHWLGSLPPVLGGFIVGSAHQLIRNNKCLVVVLFSYSTNAHSKTSNPGSIRAESNSEDAGKLIVPLKKNKKKEQCLAKKTQVV
jgi:hypothetical protein